MGNKKVEMTSALSPQQQSIEKLLGNKISGGMGQGVAPYTGAISANPDYMNMLAANIMSSFMGGGAYQLPTFQMGQNYGAQQGMPQQQGMGGGMMGGGGQMPLGGQVPQGGGQMPPGFNPFQAKRQA